MEPLNFHGFLLFITFCSFLLFPLYFMHHLLFLLTNVLDLRFSIWHFNTTETLMSHLPSGLFQVLTGALPSYALFLRFLSLYSSRFCTFLSSVLQILSWLLLAVSRFLFRICSKDNKVEFPIKT